MTALPGPIIRIHGINGAKSACRVMGGRPFDILSPAYGAGSHGAQWFADVVTRVRIEFPDAGFQAILDCRSHLSGALAAIEIGLDGVIVDPMEIDRFNKLCDMGRANGCKVTCEMPGADAIYDMEDHRLPDHVLDARLMEYIGC